MRERAREKDGWSVWMLLTVQVPCPSPPSLSPFRLSDPHLYCRVMALGSATILQEEGRS